MKALELLKIIYKDCKDWKDKGFAVTYLTNDLSEAIEELQELLYQIEKLDKNKEES